VAIDPNEPKLKKTMERGSVELATLAEIEAGTKLTQTTVGGPGYGWNGLLGMLSVR
jgi:hypothetical protein